MVKSDRHRWSHGFTAPCSHVGAAWTSDIYKIDFLAFKPFDFSPRYHGQVENSVSIPNLLWRLLIQFMSFN
jgi:hypothetical protein